MVKKDSAKKKEKLVCGIVMPISAISDCAESHWADVKEILLEAIEDAGFEGNLVSNSDDSGIIQKRIIQNLYNNPVVICDVSAKNPNVMFELGMRLAFDKPTIIVKDDKTSYSFDTSPIEHLDYPRDLRFQDIVDFKGNLKEKIKKTYEVSKSDRDYTTFLKHFGSFKVPKLDTEEISSSEYILEEIKSLRIMISSLDKGRRGTMPSLRDTLRRSGALSEGSIEILISNEEHTDERIDKILNIKGVTSIKHRDVTPNQTQMIIEFSPKSEHLRKNIFEAIRILFKSAKLF
ncbi:MAG: hypothetical protein V3S46_00280 [Nitrospinota bacterium]